MGKKTPQATEQAFKTLKDVYILQSRISMFISGNLSPETNYTNEKRNETGNCKSIYNRKKSGNNLKCPSLGECLNLITSTGLCNH